MFHALLVLPAVAVFGTVAGTVLTVLFGLLGLAFIAARRTGNGGFRCAGSRIRRGASDADADFRVSVRRSAAGRTVRGAPAAVAAFFVVLRDADVFAFRTKRDRAGAAHHRYF